VLVRLLGPVEVAGVAARDLGGPKQRAVLAALALSPGSVVSADHLITALWEDPPPSAAAVLQTYVSGLRKALEPVDAKSGRQLLMTRRPGYLLNVSPAEVDVSSFTEAVAAGRAALADGDPERAADILRSGLALWRGPALADLAELPVIRRAASLEAQRLDALELCVDADLQLGRHQELVSELEELVARDPLRERPRGQLMLALYRCGRQAQALRVYEAGRTLLADELGVDPSPELRVLFERILRQDPALRSEEDPPTTAPAQVEATGHEIRQPRAGRFTRRRKAAAFIAVPALAAIAIVLIARPESAQASPLRPGAVGLIDLATGKAEHQVELGELPSALLVAHDTLWATLSSRGVLASTHAANPDTVREVTLDPGLSGMTYAGGDVWVTQPDARRVVRVDVDTGRVAQRVAVGGRPGDLSTAGGAVWVANRLDDTVSRINPADGVVSQTVAVGRDPVALAGDADSLWVVGAGDATLTRIDLPYRGVSQRFRLTGTPGDVALAGDAVWVSDASAGTVSRVNPDSGAVLQAVPVGAGVAGLVATSESLVAGNVNDGHVTVLDPSTGEIRKRLELAKSPVVVYSDGDRLWAAAAKDEHLAHDGGVLRVLVPGPFESPDPAWLGGWLVTSVTNDGLVGLRRANGSDGAQIVPDLAAALPTPSDRGRTWTFRLRQGVRYSSGGTVHVSDVRPSFERALAPGSPYLGAIRGAEHCGNGGCDLSAGITTDAQHGTVTFHLSRPDPDFLVQLALPFASVLPADTPAMVAPEQAGSAAWSRFAATGPYRVLKVTGNSVVLTRNESFAVWAADTAPDGSADRIEVTYDVDPAQAVEQVLSGAATLLLDPVNSRVAELTARFPTRLLRSDEPATLGLMLDTRRPPFDSPLARQAVATVVERAAIAHTLERLARPGCQILPPVLVGYKPYCPYGVGPGSNAATADLAAARDLIRRSGTYGARVRLAVDARRAAAGQLVARDLRRLGYDVRIENAGPPRGTPPQALFLGWAADLPAANSFAQLARCNSDLNVTGYCDKTSEQLIDKALTNQLVAPAAVAKAWAAVDRRLTDTVAWVPLVSMQRALFVGSNAAGVLSVPMLGPALERITVS
jgi:DNA-binding SARP family transcriptional activator/ABC-type transport system substrate-binding protein